MRARDVYHSKAHIRKILAAKIEESNKAGSKLSVALADIVQDIVADSIAGFAEYLDSDDSHAKCGVVLREMLRKHK